MISNLVIMNVLESLLLKTGNSIIETEIKLKEKTSVDWIKVTYDAIEADEKLKKNYPVKWITKRITIGTIKGFWGAGLSK